MTLDRVLLKETGDEKAESTEQDQAEHMCRLILLYIFHMNNFIVSDSSITLKFHRHNWLATRENRHLRKVSSWINLRSRITQHFTTAINFMLK